MSRFDSSYSSQRSFNSFAVVNRSESVSRWAKLSSNLAVAWRSKVAVWQTATLRIVAVARVVSTLSESVYNSTAIAQ